MVNTANSSSSSRAPPSCPNNRNPRAAFNDTSALQYRAPTIHPPTSSIPPPPAIPRPSRPPTGIPSDEKGGHPASTPRLRLVLPASNSISIDSLGSRPGVPSHRSCSERLQPEPSPTRRNFLAPVHLLHPRWFWPLCSRTIMDVAIRGRPSTLSIPERTFFPRHAAPDKLSTILFPDCWTPPSRLGVARHYVTAFYYDDRGPTPISFFTGGQRFRATLCSTPSSSGHRGRRLG